MRFVAAAAVLGALLAGCGGTNSTPKSVGGCPPVHPNWRAAQPSREFFPPSRAGLWLRDDRCVYTVRLGEEKTRLVWSGRPEEHVRGLVWAPDGKSFAVTAKSNRDGWRAVVLRPDGAVLRRLRVRGVTFFRDGRLAVSRRDGIYLPAESRRLTSRAALERAAGFRARAAIVMSPDPWGYERGYGRNRLALTLWSRVGSKNAVLAVSAAGKVARASPAYRAGGGEGVVSGWAWSPDGRQLFVMAEVVPPKWRGPGDHDHCLEIWSPGRARRRASCGSRLPAGNRSHFARLVWGVHGKTGLLDNGTIVRRDGRFAGRTDVPQGRLAFEVQWRPALRSS